MIKTTITNLVGGRKRNKKQYNLSVLRKYILKTFKMLRLFTQ